MNIRYVFAIILLAVSGVLAGQSVITSGDGQNTINAFGIFIAAICLIIAVVLFIRTPLKR